MGIGIGKEWCGWRCEFWIGKRVERVCLTLLSGYFCKNKSRDIRSSFCYLQERKKERKGRRMEERKKGRKITQPLPAWVEEAQWSSRVIQGEVKGGKTTQACVN